VSGLAWRNESVQRLRRLVEDRRARWTERAFVAEGSKLVAEALAAGAALQAVYIDAGAAREADWDLAARCMEAGATLYELQDGLLGRACNTVTPQPLAAIASMLDVPLQALRAEAERVIVVCSGMQEPGNAGTVVRSAAASGAGAVVFCAGSVDVFNPKAIRSSAGALFHVPVVAGGRAEEVVVELGRWGLRRMGASARDGRDYTEVNLASRTAIVLGNESRGLSESVVARLDGLLTIPMARASESINVAMAASVICFEAARQRRLAMS
jgi:TrmH family RNA methyltransferase